MSDALGELADALGVATAYDDQAGRRVDVDADTVRAVVRALGVDPTSPDAALAELAAERWRAMLPPCVVGTAGEPVRFWAHCRHGAQMEVELVCEDGTLRRDLRQLMVWVEPAEVDGQQVGEATFELPEDVPCGYHMVVLRSEGRTARAPVVLAPARLEPVADRAWGWSVQLYATPSAVSWAHGDLADLRHLAERSAREHGAGFVLVNPLGAPAPVTPVETSPYFPSSRRYVSPLYLRVEDLPAYAAASETTVRAVDGLRPLAVVAHIDRDDVWARKRAALRLLWDECRMQPAEHGRLAAYRELEGEPLERFALWCALAERHGAGWREWPEGLRHPGDGDVAAMRADLAAEVDFHCWLQLAADEQLAAAQRAARDAGMQLGVVHDLPVGVNPDGADAWAMQDALALAVTAGAPPDDFNQQGQDWAQPPWHPGRLAAAGYAPVRDIVRSLLRHAGGLRVDHVLGFFRSWWIPEGHGPDRGTYVRYDERGMLGVLAIEAQRAGAVLVGEDLGTVEPRVPAELERRGILGTTVLLFEEDDGRPRPPEHWRGETLTAVVTHDMPTVAGYLEGAHVELRARLGRLTRPVEEERTAAVRSREAWLDLARARGLLSHDEGEAVTALHGLLARSPSRLLCAQLADAVGERRQQNLPGTRDEYPNWRLALADGAGAPVLLDAALSSPGAAAIASALRWRP